MTPREIDLDPYLWVILRLSLLAVAPIAGAVLAILTPVPGP